MSLVLSPEWGPYLDVSDARTRLCSFVDRACDPLVGVVWATPDRIYPLRAPRPNAQGYRESAVFHLGSAPPPPPVPPKDFWNKAKAFIENALAEEGRAEITQGQAQMAMASTMTDVVKRMTSHHRDDGVNLAFDILCVALSIALIPTGLGIVGIVALAGGTFLLSADGAAYACELAGEDEQAEAVKRATEKWRILATILTLPDGLVGGWKALHEIGEVREALALDRATAMTADRLGAHTSNADRATRYKQVAERAASSVTDQERATPSRPET